MNTQTQDWVKEAVASVLSLAIVFFTLYVLYQMLTDTSTDKTQWLHQSATLQTVIALAGTVTGYYFGRIPAERAADAAQRQSATNSAERKVAVDNENRLRTNVQALHQELTTPLGGGAPSNAQVVQRLQEILTRS